MWIRLKNIQIYAYHGVYEHEREHGGRFEIDVELKANFEQATKTDDIADTVDYTRLLQLVTFVATTNKYQLLETLANAIASEVIANYAGEEVVIRVRKPGAPVGGILDYVEVECHKSRS